MSKSPEDKPAKKAESTHDRRTREAAEFNRRMRRDMTLTWTARTLMLVGLIIISQHLVAHAGYRPIPMAMGVQDLTIGYPAGALVLIAGVFIWGRKPSR